MKICEEPKLEPNGSILSVNFIIHPISMFFDYISDGHVYTPLRKKITIQQSRKVEHSGIWDDVYVYGLHPEIDKKDAWNYNVAIEFRGLELVL